MWVKWCVFLHFIPKELRNPWDPRDAQARNTEGAARPSPHGRRSSRARKARGVAKPFLHWSGGALIAPPSQRGAFSSPLLGFGFPCPSFLVVVFLLLWGGGACSLPPSSLLLPSPLMFGKWCSLLPTPLGGPSSFGLVLISPFLFEVMVISFSRFRWWCFSLVTDFLQLFWVVLVPRKNSTSPEDAGSKAPRPKGEGKAAPPNKRKGEHSPTQKEEKEHPTQPPQHTTQHPVFFVFFRFFVLVVSQNNHKIKTKKTQKYKKELNNRNQIQKRKKKKHEEHTKSKNLTTRYSTPNHPTTPTPNPSPDPTTQPLFFKCSGYFFFKLWSFCSAFLDFESFFFLKKFVIGFQVFWF